MQTDQTEQTTQPESTTTPQTEQTESVQTTEPVKPTESTTQPEEAQPVEQVDQVPAEEEGSGKEAPAEEPQPVQCEKTRLYATTISDACALFNELSPIDKWELYGETSDLKSYTRLDVATGLKMARGDGFIMRPVESIVKQVLDTEAVKKWANNLSSHVIVEESDYIVYRSIDIKRMFVTQRETVVVTKAIKQEDGSTLVVQRSVEHPDYPEIKDYVRAGVYLFAWLLNPDKEDENKTNVTSMIFVDPKGWVPVPVFNAFVHDQAQSVKKLKDYMEKL